MIPQFPEFKKIELSDREDIEHITSQYPPYSDFNFVSMWSWDVDVDMAISKLNENLVVKFSDYITSEPFFSFLGNSKVNATVDTLLDRSNKINIQTRLKLVPELAIKSLDIEKFLIEEDRANFDYILSLEKLADFVASHMRDHYNFDRRFKEANEGSYSHKLLDLHDEDHRQEIMSLTEIWMQNKNQQGKSFSSHLENAVQRYLDMTAHEYHENLICVGILINNKLIAFTINELVGPDYSICHFMKGDTAYKGLYSHLVTTTAQELLKTGRKYINFEQDLGLKNLRQAKNTYEPVDFLKKYNITRI